METKPKQQKCKWMGTCPNLSVDSEDYCTHCFKLRNHRFRTLKLCVANYGHCNNMLQSSRPWCKKCYRHNTPRSCFKCDDNLLRDYHCLQHVVDKLKNKSHHDCSNRGGVVCSTCDHYYEVSSRFVGTLINMENSSKKCKCSSTECSI